MQCTLLVALLAGVTVINTRMRTVPDQTTMAMRTPMFLTADGAARAACSAPGDPNPDHIQQRIQERMNGFMQDQYTWRVDVSPTGAAATGPQLGEWDSVYVADCDRTRIKIRGVRKPSA